MKKRRIIYGVAFFVILSLLALQKNHIEAASEAKYEIRNEIIDVIKFNVCYYKKS